MADGPPIAIPPGAVRLGVGAIGELGHDARALGLSTVLVITDATLHAAGVPGAAIAALEAAGVWSETLVAPVSEPTDVLIEQLAQAASPDGFDGVVAIGGGSVIDIAKAVDLLLTSGGSLIEYVNAPFGEGRPPRRALLPLIAVPTTSGSGSECSAVAVLDLVEQGVKTAISHPALRPVLAIADPATTLTVPPSATAAAALDVLAHALESLTSLAREHRPEGVPGLRPAYIGANPYSTALCEAALPLLSRGIAGVVDDPASLSARSELMEASTLSALGAAVAGAHVGHACAYAIAGRVPGVAHGFAAAVMLSSLMRATFETDPPAHARYAEALAAPLGVELSQRDPREQLPTVIEHLLGRLSAPRDLTDLGLSEDDVAPMAAAALRQERLMAGAPVPIGAAELEALLRDALRWPSSSSATPSR